MVAARLENDLVRLSMQEQRREAGKASGKARSKTNGETTVASPLVASGKPKGRVRAAVAKQAGVSERKVRKATEFWLHAAVLTLGR